MAAQLARTRGENKNAERIRGSELAILVKRANGVPFVEGLKMADEKGLVIASNARLDKALVESGEWGSISDVFPCWSGTMTAYTKPGKKLGKTIEYVDPETKERWVFRVPEEHQGKKNAILVAEHPEYKVEVDGKNIVVHAANVDLITQFPASNGRYPTEAKHGIPTEAGSSDERYLRRIIYSRVAPIARSCWYGSSRRLVGLRPSRGLGMAVESLESRVSGLEDAPKVEASGRLTIREESGRLIVEGTSEQIATAARVLEQLKQK